MYVGLEFRASVDAIRRELRDSPGGRRSTLRFAVRNPARRGRATPRALYRTVWLSADHAAPLTYGGTPAGNTTRTGPSKTELA